MAMHPSEFPKIAITWACMQARLLGLTWTVEGNMWWVQDGENEIGCDGSRDFVAYVNETRKARKAAKDPHEHLRYPGFLEGKPAGQ